MLKRAKMETQGRLKRLFTCVSSDDFSGAAQGSFALPQSIFSNTGAADRSFFCSACCRH
jgi:hypothetical protein